MKRVLLLVIIVFLIDCSQAQKLESSILLSAGYNDFLEHPIPSYMVAHNNSYKIYQENIYCRGQGTLGASIGLLFSKKISKRISLETGTLLSYKHISIIVVDENYYEEYPLLNSDGSLRYDASGQPLFERTNFEATVESENLYFQIPVTASVQLSKKVYFRGGIENSISLSRHTSEKLNDDMFQYVFDSKLRRNSQTYLIGLTGGLGSTIARRFAIEANYQLMLTDFYQRIDNGYNQLVPCQIRSSGIFITVRTRLK